MTQPEEAPIEDVAVEDVAVEDVAATDVAAPVAGTATDVAAPAAGTATDVAAGQDAPAGDGLDLSDPAALRSALEALLFVADAPVQLSQLAAAVQRPVAEVAQELAEITADLDRRDAGWQLRPAATGFRLYTRDRYAPVVEAFLLDGQRAKLSQAALETLAVVAYRQPVTRARISAIRGVNVDGVVRTLLARELITEVGSDPETGGGLYRTTDTFLEKMGIASVDELPSLAPLLPELDTLDLDEM
jgi:segregation and condensation protein B